MFIVYPMQLPSEKGGSFVVLADGCEEARLAQPGEACAKFLCLSKGWAGERPGGGVDVLEAERGKGQGSAYREKRQLVAEELLEPMWRK